MNKPQELGRRPVKYMNMHTGEPLTEDEARYIDYWIKMGFDVTNPEFKDILENGDPCPEIRKGSYYIN